MGREGISELSFQKDSWEGGSSLPHLHPTLSN